MIKRFDRLEVATTDLAAATAAYEHNFGFSVARSADGAAASIAIGDAEIRVRSGSSVADLIAASGEGLATLWLEADDVEQMAATLHRAGVRCAPVYQEDGKRILAV